MRSLIFAVTLVVMGCSSVAHAQIGYGYGLGLSDTCGEAMQNIERHGREAEYLYIQWVFGFLSGYNAATADLTKKDSMVSAGVSADTITAMFKNKCRQDALKNFGTVAVEIRKELEKRKP